MYDLGVIPLEEVQDVTRMAKIYLNGKLLGLHENYKPLVETIRMKQRRGDLNSNVNIAYYPDSNEVQINCDAGRARTTIICGQER